MTLHIFHLQEVFAVFFSYFCYYHSFNKAIHKKTALAASASFNIIVIVSLMGTVQGALGSLNLSAVVIVSTYNNKGDNINDKKGLR